MHPLFFSFLSFISRKQIVKKKVNTLRAKYSTLAGKLRGSGDGDPNGEGSKSQVYYMIKRAQEREELQQKGDALDAQIRKTESDVKKLYNSLRHLVNSNAVRSRHLSFPFLFPHFTFFCLE